MTDYERIPYATHLDEFQWRQGEHLFLSGPTGSGKTTLARTVLERRKYVVAFCIKNRDETIRKDYSDYQIVGDMSEIEPWMDKVMIWPRIRKGDGDAWLAHQGAVITDALSKLLKAAGWTVFIDELNYISKYWPRASRYVEAMHYVGRSSGLTMVTAAQRPANVPLAVLTNSSHAYIARTRFESDLKRLSDFGDIDPKSTARTLVGLPSKHDFLYIPTAGDGRAAIVNTRK